MASKTIGSTRDVACMSRYRGRLAILTPFIVIHSIFPPTVSSTAAASAVEKEVVGKTLMRVLEALINTIDRSLGTIFEPDKVEIVKEGFKWVWVGSTLK